MNFAVVSQGFAAVVAHDVVVVGHGVVEVEHGVVVVGQGVVVVGHGVVVVGHGVVVVGHGVVEVEHGVVVVGHGVVVVGHGVYTTAVGYCGGHETGIEPSYEQVCTGNTGHNEVTQVVWDPNVISFADLLCQFWRCHDPTQGNRQGNDRGSQYRSGIYCCDEIQASAARASLVAFDKAVRQRGFPAITTEVRVGVPFHYAEDYHQQYLATPGSR